MQHLITDALKLLGPDFSDTLVKAFEEKISKEQSSQNSTLNQSDKPLEQASLGRQRTQPQLSQQTHQNESRSTNTFQPIFTNAHRANGVSSTPKSNMPRTFLRPDQNQPNLTQEGASPMVGNHIRPQQFNNQQFPQLYSYYPQNMSMPNQPMYNPMLATHPNMFGMRPPYCK